MRAMVSERYSGCNGGRVSKAVVLFDVSFTFDEVCAVFVLSKNTV